MAKPVSLAQDLVWRLETLGYDILTTFFRLLPLDFASAASGRLLRLLGPLNGAHRIARINIELVFPDMPQADRERILGDQWENIGRAFAEFASMDRIRPSTGRVELINGERLTEIAAGGHRRFRGQLPDDLPGRQ